MELWMTIGTKTPLSGLVVQNCLLLKAAAGFDPLTNDNEVFDKPYVACRNGNTRDRSVPRMIRREKGYNQAGITEEESEPGCSACQCGGRLDGMRR